MPQQVITFLKGDKMGGETDYRDNLPVNMTAIVKPMFGAQGYMLEVSGLSQFVTSSGVCRGAVYNERFGSHFRVQGSDFVEVDASGAVTVLGTIDGTDTVSLPYSFNTQAIITKSRYYLYDPVIGFRRVTDNEVGNVIDGVWIDGFYCFTDGESLFHTEISDEEAIDPLNYEVSQFSPDPTIGVGKTTDNKWIAFNRYTIEYFVNDGSSNFAFSRVPTRAVKIGLVGTHAKCEMADQWFFVGGRKEEGISVYSLGVGTATEIATREVTKILGEYTEEQLRSVVLEARVEDAQAYLIMHLPDGTLMFNYTLAKSNGLEGAWSILKTGVNFDTWRGKHGIFEPRLGKWLYGDKVDGRIGLLDESLATQYDEIQEWYLNTPFMYLEEASVDQLEIETISGFTGNDDASVFIALSYDGVFWGKEWTELYGSPTEYNKRFIVRRLGYVRDWFTLRLRGASRSRMAFSRAFINYG